MISDEQRPVNLPGFSPGAIPPQRLVEADLASINDLRQLCFQYMRDGFSIVDTNGLHVDVNPAFCEMTGFSVQELIGSGPQHCYWPPEERVHIEAAFAKSLRGELADIELVFMRKNGERFPVIVKPFAIGDHSGIPRYYAATVRDMTQRVYLQSVLQDSEARYRGLFESAADAIVILQGETLVDCNHRALEMFGLSSVDQLSSLASFDFFPPLQPDGKDSRAFSVEKLRAARAGAPQFFAWRHVKVDGTVFDAEISLSTFKLGEQTFIQAIIRDVTQRTQLEEALRLGEQRYRNLFEHAGDGILIMEGEQVIDCNQRVLDIYGISREQLMSLTNYSLSPPMQPNGQASSEFYLGRLEALRSGIPQSFEWLGCKLDGTPVLTEVTLTTVMLDGKLHTQSLIRDITRRKQLEEALRNSELRYRTLFDNAGDSIVIMKGAQIVDCNARTLEQYGYSREEIFRNSATARFPLTQPNGRDSNEFFSEMLEASCSGVPQVFEWTGQNFDGTAVCAEVTLTSFMLDGTMYSQSIVRDITRRKAMEAALIDLNKNLEERVAQRTEELETACAELLQRNAQFRTLASKLTRAEEEERRRIARLLHDNHQQLLVAAKFKAEMLETQLYGPDVNAAGTQLVYILEQAIEVTRSLTMELAPPILYGSGFVDAMHWLAVWMEEHYQLQVLVSGSLPTIPIPAEVSSVLFRAVRELLFNVSKHAGVQQALVSVVAFDNGLRITVSDNGSGFDVADVLQTPRSYGLFSIREQLTSLDGSLDIVSAPHSGTVITISVPVLASADVLPPVIWSDEDRITTEVADTQHTLTHPIRILVADDHALARNALVQMLDMVEDFDVVGEAFDGLDALEKTRLLQPELVLMDATMPRLDGLAATRGITAEFPTIKVIGLSMHPRQDMEPRFTEAGAAYYLQKLTSTEELFAAIRGVMDRGVAESSK